MSYRKTETKVPLVGQEKTFRKVYGGQVKQVSHGYVLLEQVKEEKRTILIANEDENAALKRWKIVQVGGEWYPHQGVQIPFLHQIGDEVLLAPGTQLCGVPETGDGFDTPQRVVTMMGQVLGTSEPLAATEQDNAN